MHYKAFLLRHESRKIWSYERKRVNHYMHSGTINKTFFSPKQEHYSRACATTTKESFCFLHHMHGFFEKTWIHAFF